MRQLELAAHAHDVERVIACLADEIIIRSLITQRIRFVGIEQAADLFRRLFLVVDDIRVYETVGDGERTQVIFWKGRIGRHNLEKANLLCLDDDGRICEMTVFMRPIPGLLALATELAASFTDRRHPARAWAVRGLLGTLATMYALGEPAIVSLAGAGVPTKA
jgi:hypothetical protein